MKSPFCAFSPPFSPESRQCYQGAEEEEEEKEREERRVAVGMGRDK